MTEQYYSVRVGTRGNTPNRGEHPTGEDFYQASEFGLAPTGRNVGRIVGASPTEEVAEVAQATQTKRVISTEAVVFQA